jgi:hypothetical protein
MKAKEPIMPIKVECYAGYRGAETPRVIWFKSRKIEIKQVLDRWLELVGVGVNILSRDTEIK